MAKINRAKGFDVTGEVNVCEPASVKNEVIAIFKDIFPKKSTSLISESFQIFTDLYSGKIENYNECDVPYHNVEHIMDVTLASARLIYGLKKTKELVLRKIVDLDREHALCVIIGSLFHDSGYLTLKSEKPVSNGAVHTKIHVSRSVKVLAWVMDTLSFQNMSRVATEAVHYTGYERDLTSLDLKDTQEETVGRILGTADLLGQMSDRCYLEKCYYRLFPEFVLGGLHRVNDETIYGSPDELMRRTRDFYINYATKRMQNDLGYAFHLADSAFDNYNINLYSWYIEKNQNLLAKIISTKKPIKEALKRDLSKSPAPINFPYDEVQRILNLTT